MPQPNYQLKQKSYAYNFLGGAASATIARRNNDKDLYNATLSATELAANLSSSLKAQQKTKAVAELEQRSQVGNKESDQLMEIEKLRKKLEDTEREMAKLIAEMNNDQYEAKVSIINRS